MKKKRKRIKKGPMFLLILIVLAIGGFLVYRKIENDKKLRENMTMYIASSELSVPVYDKEGKEVTNIVRGNKVLYYENVILEDGKVKITNNEQEYYINKDNLVKEYKDVVKENKIFVRTSIDLLKSLDDYHLETLVKKGDELNIIGFDKLDDKGEVVNYKVKTSDEHEGYVNRKYLAKTLEEANKNYDENGKYKVHKERGNRYGGGDAATLDYYPVEKPEFSDNKMPEQVYALYINGGKYIIANVDNYIKYAKETKINAFVVDIKDSGVTGYASPFMKEASPTSYKNAQTSFEDYKKAIKKIKDAGFYVIGRITTFKDDYFIADHKEFAIARGGSPLKYSSAYWPSAFQRGVWEYNIGLAIEAVKEMGFNEIQFDYVRFPDRMQSIESSLDYLNTYKETKVQAIQRFVMYATEMLHKYNVYVSIDVFGESSWGYVTAYGQYWPAISNVADVISAMPYTDHFDRNNSSYWTNPYNTMKTWGKTAAERQAEIPTPAVARTWITAYNPPYWSSNKVSYNGPELEAQIKGLYEVGLKGGYMTWNSASNLEKYKLQKSAFTKEYK